MILKARIAKTMQKRIYDRAKDSTLHKKYIRLYIKLYIKLYITLPYKLKRRSCKDYPKVARKVI